VPIEVSLKEIFEWRRDWRLFGTLSVYNSDVERTITLRGYVRSFGVLADGEAREAGAAVQLRF
jgi:hypothetical protein